MHAAKTKRPPHCGLGRVPENAGADRAMHAHRLCRPRTRRERGPLYRCNKRGLYRPQKRGRFKQEGWVSERRSTDSGQQPQQVVWGRQHWQQRLQKQAPVSRGTPRIAQGARDRRRKSISKHPQWHPANTPCSCSPWWARRCWAAELPPRHGMRRDWLCAMQLRLGCSCGGGVMSRPTAARLRSHRLLRTCSVEWAAITRPRWTTSRASSSPLAPRYPPNSPPSLAAASTATSFAAC
jgi:hypothetical protein